MGFSPHSKRGKGEQTALIGSLSLGHDVDRSRSHKDESSLPCCYYCAMFWVSFVVGVRKKKDEVGSFSDAALGKQWAGSKGKRWAGLVAILAMEIGFGKKLVL
ncbi:hypothetical protein KY285_009466 [Solanum tuberosum]|nr:hypothetical protein KY285_009466 [Solanum tuberosum]